MDTTQGDEITAYRKAVAAEVRALMGRGVGDGKRVTNARLAEHLGMSPQSFGERLSGKQPFDTDELFSIAHFFDVQIDALIPPTDSLTTDRYPDSAADQHLCPAARPDHVHA